MSFERPKRPKEVDEAIKAGDKEKIRALGRAGGIAAAQRREERKILEDVAREVQEEQAWRDRALQPSPAEARRDDLLPEDN